MYKVTLMSETPYSIHSADDEVGAILSLEEAFHKYPYSRPTLTRHDEDGVLEAPYSLADMCWYDNNSDN